MKHYSLIFLITIFMFFNHTAVAEVPVYKADYFKTWMICGPFPNPETPDGRRNVPDLPGMNTDYLHTHGGEENLTVKPGQVERYDGGEAEWIEYTSDTPEIWLDNATGAQNFVLAYAYCEYHANEDSTYLMALGSNDGVRVWINGEEVWRFSGGRSLQRDQDVAPISLKKGNNSILLKVENGMGNWGFSFRLLPFSIEHFQQKRFFKMSIDDGKNVITATENEQYLKNLFHRVEFRLKSASGSDEIIWQKEWPCPLPITIDLESDEYREYCLETERWFVNGAQDSVSMMVRLGPIQRYVLFENGQTDYRIVLGDEAGESEIWAANELQHWLKEISGIEFPVADDSRDLSSHEIIVGINRHTEQILGGRTPKLQPGDESFTIENAGPHILIYGGKERGTMYGVMDFLEQDFGCRWYTPSVSVIPKKDRYEFLFFERKDAPGLQVRNDFYFEAFEPIWAARNRINGAMSYREQPGGLEGYWGVHTFNYFVPPDEFFETHPEYYSLIDGERTVDHAQLCLTNNEVLQIVIERVKKFIRDNPQYLIYSVSQNDWHGACQCENCQAIVEREGSEAGPLLIFVNQVADAIKDEFPNKYIGTLAYQYTRETPKTIRPRDNVVIRLCSIECCFSHSFYDCPTNQEFLQDLREWSKRAPHLYIWDYVVNFRHYILPHPNFKVLQPNLQAFQENNAIGVMEQACYNTRGGEFSELRAYVLAKLLWDPKRDDVESIIDDFMYGYYGRSGQYIREYFDMIHDAITPDTHLHIFDGIDRPMFQGDFVLKADKLFNKAETVAENETIRERVEMARLPVMYLKLQTDLKLAVKDGTFERFVKICEREGISRMTEHLQISEFLNGLEKSVAKLE